jgi:hypothetical protein
MDIKSGQAESHPTPLSLDTSATPGVAPQPQRFPSETGRDGSQGGVAGSIAGVDFTDDARQAMHAGMAADADRRTGYAADMNPVGANYGDLLPLPAYGTDGTVAGHRFDPPRSGSPADTA